MDYLRVEWNNKAVGIVSYGSVSVAHVRVHPALSLFTDFENGSVFKPKAEQVDSLNQMLDQVIPWTTALKTLRP